MTIASKYRPSVYRMLNFPTEKDYDLYFSLIDDYDIQYIFKKYPEIEKKYIQWQRLKKLQHIDFIYNN